MVNAYEFEKQFKNMGIDKNAILGANQPQAKQEEISQSSQESFQHSTHQEMQLLKRKLDYLTNMLLPSIDERFKALEAKLEREVANLRGDKKDYVVLRNEVNALKNQLKTIRIVFGDEAPAVQPQQFSSQSAAQQQTQGRQSSQESPAPGDESVRIDKIFNYSNHKF